MSSLFYTRWRTTCTRFLVQGGVKLPNTNPTTLTVHALHKRGPYDVRSFCMFRRICASPAASAPTGSKGARRHGKTLHPWHFRRCWGCADVRNTYQHSRVWYLSTTQLDAQHGCQSARERTGWHQPQQEHLLIFVVALGERTNTSYATRTHVRLEIGFQHGLRHGPYASRAAHCYRLHFVVAAVRLKHALVSRDISLGEPLRRNSQRLKIRAAIEANHLRAGKNRGGKHSFNHEKSITRESQNRINNLFLVHSQDHDDAVRERIKLTRNETEKSDPRHGTTQRIVCLTARPHPFPASRTVLLLAASPGASTTATAPRRPASPGPLALLCGRPLLLLLLLGLLDWLARQSVGQHVRKGEVGCRVLDGLLLALDLLQHAQ